MGLIMGDLCLLSFIQLNPRREVLGGREREKWVE
jgi:hypothetical protein